MPKSNNVVISVRLPKELVSKIENLAKRKKIDKSTIFRMLIEKGLRQELLEDVFNSLKLQKISVWKAAETLNISYREMLELLKRNNIPFPINKKGIETELQELFKDDSG